MMLVLALGLAITLAACSNDSNSASDSENDKNTADKKSDETAQPAQPAQVDISDKEKVDNDKVVSQINGKDIKGEQYNASYSQTKMLMSQNGQDLSDVEKIKEQTLNVITEQVLIKQDAEEQGIKVADKEVEAQLEKIKSEKPDQYKQVLKQFQLTEDAYKNQLTFELTLQKYMDQEIEVAEASDKEVQTYYDKLKEQGQDGQKIPELAAVKDQIKTAIVQQKQQVALSKKLETLKKDAEIKKMI